MDAGLMKNSLLTGSWIGGWK